MIDLLGLIITSMCTIGFSVVAGFHLANKIVGEVHKNPLAYLTVYIGFNVVILFFLFLLFIRGVQ